MHPGQVIADRFTVERLANSGGMGAVYRAFDRVTGGAVALKVLQGCSAQAAAMFSREAEVLAELRHPGIVKYIDHGRTEGGALWLAMEWLEGEDLDSRLRRAPLTVGETLSLGRRAAEALGAAHAAGIVHRDVKPSNLIIIGRDIALAKIVDFGIARSRQATRPATRTGSLLGTPGYMPPEQTLGAKDLDGTADVFSLGCVLYECLTGQAAFGGEHVMVVLAKILVGEAPRVRDLRPDVPEDFEALIARMMAKDPADRPRDGMAVALQIAAIEVARGRRTAPSAPDGLDRRPSDPGAPEDAVVADSRPSDPEGEPAAPITRRRPPEMDLDPPPLFGAHRFVGRARELAMLEACYAECVWSPCARVVLVSGAVGSGKSALIRRFLARLKESDQPAEVWVGKGNSMLQGSPFGLISRAVRRAAGIEGGAPLRVRQDRLRSRVRLHLPDGEVTRITGFLGEMVGVPFTEDPDLPLRAALQDARLMGAQIRRAFEDWLAAECAARPVVIVLEDLEAGDPPSIDLLAATLRYLRDSPLLVLCTGLPTVKGLFPQLFNERSRGIQLGDLPDEDAARLIREALEPLGGTAPAQAVADLVERAAGNPLHLEELIRAAVEPGDAPLPASPREAFEASLAALPAEAQGILRAASVFGDAFSEAGLRSIHKDTIVDAELSGWLACRHWLSVLVEREIVVRRGGRSISDPEEFVFRHDLLREVTYLTLDHAERVTFHRRAGEWLERVVEGEPGALARHFEIGGEPARAAGWCALGAERSLEGDDFAGIVSFTERGIALGASGHLLGTLRLLCSEAYKWRGEHAAALALALAAMEELPPGSAHWYSAAGQAALVSGNIGDHDHLTAVFHEIRANHADSAPHVIALSRVALQLLQAGLHDLSELAFADLTTVDDDVIRRDPEVAASIYRARGFLSRFAGDPAASLSCFTTAADAFEEVGDLLNACVQQVNVGWVNIELGSYAEAERSLREALSRADRLGLGGLTAFARHNLGLTLARLGQVREARLVETCAVEAYRAQGDRRLEGGSRVYLSLILAMEGDIGEAARQAEEAVEIVSAHPPLRAFALAALGQARLLQGQAASALLAAEEALRLLEELGGIDEGEALVRLVHAAALGQTGRLEAARAAIGAARDRLLARAGRITAPSLRASFLERVPEHARTLMLARQWASGVSVSDR